MNAKGSTWVWAAALMVFLTGAGLGGLWIWKKMRAKRMMQENQRWEVSMALPLQRELSGSELTEMLEMENERLDRYEVLRPVIDELDLVTFWGVAGPDEALEQLKEYSGFREGKESGTVMFVASDKDKEMAGKIGGAVWKSYENMQRRERYLLPTAPVSAE